MNILENSINYFDHKLLINQPTRITSSSSTCIDNIITNSDQIISSGVVKTAISDHEGIFATINTKNGKASKYQSTFKNTSLRETLKTQQALNTFNSS